MIREDLRSGLADEIWAFLEFKRACGVSSRDRDWLMRDMDGFFARTGADAVDRASIEGYIGHRIETARPQTYNWICYVRDFTRWASLEGVGSYVVPAGSYRTGNKRKTPYLLTEAEVEAFFDAIPKAGLRSAWSWQAKPFFGLMHACGLRTGEARALTVGDVDLEAGRIAVRYSKGNRTRVLPVTGEVREMLAASDAAASEAFGPGREAFFACGPNRAPSKSAVAYTFGRVWEAAGLPKEKSGAKPRAYCFRHRFAYANIERWAREGRDVGAMLPYLAKYMGHACIESTCYYVHTSPDFMAGFADAARATDSVMPEVGFDG